MSDGHLPNLIVIGAAKSGTTSLHRYLALHPDISMSEQKELRFFVPEKQHGRYHLGLDWYRAQFPQKTAIRGETSPQYALYPKITDIPQNIHRTLGTPKLIYLLRDPIERLLSGYVQAVEENYNCESFEQMLERIVDAEQYYFSRYFLQLSRYLDVFPRENIMLVTTERMKTDTRQTLQSIFEFLGVDPSFFTQDFVRRHNVARSQKYPAGWFDAYAPEFLKEQLREPVLRSKAWKIYKALHWTSRLGGKPLTKPVLTEKQEDYLQGLFREDVAKIREFLGDPLPEWRAYN